MQGDGPFDPKGGNPEEDDLEGWGVDDIAQRPASEETEVEIPVLSDAPGAEDGELGSSRPYGALRDKAPELVVPDQVPFQSPDAARSGRSTLYYPGMTPEQPQQQHGELRSSRPDGAPRDEAAQFTAEGYAPNPADQSHGGNDYNEGPPPRKKRETQPYSTEEQDQDEGFNLPDLPFLEGEKTPGDAALPGTEEQAVSPFTPHEPVVTHSGDWEPSELETTPPESYEISEPEEEPTTELGQEPEPVMEPAPILQSAPAPEPAPAPAPAPQLAPEEEALPIDVDEEPQQEESQEERRPRGTMSHPPAIDPLPLDKPLPEGENTWLTKYQIFKAVSQKLARVGDWRKLAAITGHALLKAPYAARMTRTGMLLDLARVYRDRLKDVRRAEQAFAVLAQEDPSSGEAIEFLVEAYTTRGEWEAIYDLYLSAVEASWDPNERLSWTEQAADVALSKLSDDGLAIKAWEHLWKLGDALEDTSRELSRLYRRTARWAEMAEFLQEQADRCTGAEQLVVLRELAEVKLSGLRDPDGASQVLEQIVERSPQDPIATLQLARVYAQRKDWDSLVRLGQQAASDQVAPEAALDLQHLVAEALWQAGLLEQAVEAYDRILLVDPANYDGNRRKQEFLTQTGHHEELLALVVAEADNTADTTKRGEILARAALLAEEKLGDITRAISLWESRITLDSEHLPAFEALARLHENNGDLDGVAGALEGQLGLTKEPRRRIDLLRLLGEHYAQRMGQDEKAEACWKEILSIDPNDLPVREELINLHRRRGDFESLNSALLRQIWLTADDQRAENLCRTAAENLDENFDDSTRSIDAWQRVLDFAPMDIPAFQALKKHFRRLEQRLDLVATLEREIRSSGEDPTRIERSLQVAQLWEDEKDPKGAAACFERILRWDPIFPEALEGLFRIYSEAGQRGKASGALEHASVLIRDSVRRVELLRGCLALLPADDHFARFSLLRRILFLAGGDRQVVKELEAEAEAHGDDALWHELAAVLAQLACTTEESAARVELHQELSQLFEKKLSTPVRAYLSLQGVLLSPEHQEQVLEEANRLARKTKRYEDLLAILDRLTTPEFDLARRKEVLQQRAAICEKEVGNPLRAFHEIRRVLELDPDDWGPLEELERLAGDNDLWRQYDAFLTELWDRATLPSERMDLLARREHVAREKLNDRALAFDLLIRRFRLDPEDLDLLRQLTEDAEALDAWAWSLPILEATQLSSSGDTAANERAVTAALYEQKLGARERAFTLYASAFTEAPEAQDLADKLEELADQTGRYEALASTFREAAAVSQNSEQTIDLLRRTARIYEDKLSAVTKAFEIHRRLLHLKADELRSLEVVIDWHRDRSEWRDLRDRLNQWIRLAPQQSDRIPKLMEIADISEQHLDDPEGALETYGKILELDPGHDAARTGLKGLVVSITEPSMRIRWLRMELKSAADAHASELRLEIANIQEQDLEDRDGAIATLRDLVQETGPKGPGFEPLSRLLRQTERWKGLVLLLESASELLDQRKEQLAALDEAIDIYHEHTATIEAELGEKLYRSLLQQRPHDLGIRVRLARTLRQQGRFEELADLLEQSIEYIQQTEPRISSLHELGRVNALNLGRLDQAKRFWQQVSKEAPDDQGAVLGLAWVASQQGSVKEYVEYRKRQAGMLPPTEAALVLCHLAEVCDEHEELGAQKVPFYREARKLDPNNMPAMEALKGIGRRLKNLRPAAALLPFDGERELDPAERAKRLKALGDGALDSDQDQALEWYLRACVMAPDDSEHWDMLARQRERRGDLAGAYHATLGWLHAVNRTEPMDPGRLMVDAERLYDLASSARQAGETTAYKHWVHYAYDLVPNHAPSALATAQAMIEDGNIEGAHALLHSILTQHRAELTDAQQVRAFFCRGLTLRELGKREEAASDFRESLRTNPLHAEALIALGELQARTGRFAAALEHQIRALTVTEELTERAQLYHRIGVLWEDGLHATEEAGACYELALAGGVTERDLLHRSLRHLQRTGRLDQSLEVVNNLLPTAQDPDELATLWLVKGEIFAAREGQEDEALEAFDMALSYDPGRNAARDGLTMVLERRGDWQQLLQVLEATFDVAGPEQQGEALRRMADICSLQLGDQQRAEEHLRRSVEIFPTRDALEYLEQIYTVESGRVEERKEVVGLLVSFGPPWFDRCMELAKLLLAEDKPWAWCLLSPLLGVSQVEPDIKAVVQAMRKEYERPPVLSPADEDSLLLIHPAADPVITEILAKLGQSAHPLGVSALDQAGDGGAIAISENTNMGKIFAAAAENAGLTGCTLHRTQTVPESVQVVNSRPEPAVVVRTEVIQQLVHAEVGFFFAYALELAKPGYRVMAALPQDQRDMLFPALWSALGYLDSVDAATGKLAAAILEHVEDQTRSELCDALEEHGLHQQDPRHLGRAWWDGVCHTARRAGLVAGADLRQVFRVMSRLEDQVPRPRVVARVDELDEYVAGSPMLQDLVAFSASPGFGQILKAAKAVVEG